VMVGY